MDPWIPALAGAGLLALLALKLRGPRNRTDLRRPPRRRRRKMTADEVRQVRRLVARGDEGGAIRLIRKAGFDEAEALKLVGLVARFEPPAGPLDSPPEPGWTESVQSEDGLSYGRAFDYNPTLHDQGHRDKR